MGNSEYQKDSSIYYNLLRDVHTKIFSFNPERIEAEKKSDRYINANIKGVRNLYTFINILRKLMEEKIQVKGVDYGCGNHFFIDDVRNQFGWDVRGYDVDKAAIEEAQKKYPRSAEYYLHLDLLKNKIPLADGSQDFVVCNAVIQHFSNSEVLYAFKEISRILKMGGVLVLIFKHKINNWDKFSEETGLTVKVLDAKEGKIKIEDEPMKKAVQKLSNEEQSKLESDYLQGLRLFHFFSIDEIVKMAQQMELAVLTNLEFGGTRLDEAIFTYRSGKGIPTAAIFFRKR